MGDPLSSLVATLARSRGWVQEKVDGHYPHLPPSPRLPLGGPADPSMIGRLSYDDAPGEEPEDEDFDDEEDDEEAQGE